MKLTQDLDKYDLDPDEHNMALMLLHFCKTTPKEYVSFEVQQLMKLGFEKRVLRSDGFYNLLLNGKQVGFNLDLRINYYRGLPLSSVQKIEVKVDGETIPQELMLLQLREKVFTLSELPNLYREYWGIKIPAHLRIFNYGLEPGEHDVEVRIEYKSPYMEFAPGIFGMIDGSGAAKMELQKGVKQITGK